MSRYRTALLTLSFTFASAPPALAQYGPPMPGNDTSGGAGNGAAASSRQGNLHVYVGPALELGQQTVALKQTTTVTTTPNSIKSGTTKSTVSSTASPTAAGSASGLTLGARYTWWVAPRFGLGIDEYDDLSPIFGLGNQSTNILHLNGQNSSAFKGSQTTSGNVTSTTNTQTTIAVTPVAFGSPNFNIIMSNQGPDFAANDPNSTEFQTDYGIQVPDPVGGGQQNFTLTSGDSSANPQHDHYDAAGGLQVANSDSLWINDLGLTGNYRLWQSAGGYLGLLAGIQVPIIRQHIDSVVRTIDSGNKPGAAVETKTTFDATGAQTEKDVTSTTIADDYTADTFVLAAGPIVGISGAYDIFDGLDLTVKAGYVPVLVGSNWGSSMGRTSAEVNYQVFNGASTSPATTTDTTSSSNAPDASVGQAGGNEALASLGVGGRVGPVDLSGEIVARTYNVVSGANSVFSDAELGVRVSASRSF